MIEKSEFLKEELRKIADKLENWATESKEGGWSTHQVRPMQNEAKRIYEILGRMK